MSKWLVMWDCQGLESVIDLGNTINDFFMDALRGSGSEGMNSLVRTYNMMQVRARANGQRHYEIYSFETNFDATEQDVRDWFTDDSQAIVELIRANGVKLYSDRYCNATNKIS